MPKSDEKLPLLKPVPTQRASEVIFEQIRDMILSGELKKGDRLPSERSMMAMLQRSRPTIREALRMLERAELIKTIPGSGGAIVQEPSSQSVEVPLETLLALSNTGNKELWEYRNLNEVAAAGWAAERRSEEDLVAMLGYIEASKRVNDMSEFFRLDREFHEAIASAGKNRIAQLVDKVLHKIVILRLDEGYRKKNAKDRKRMIEKVIESHMQLYEAIERQDVVDAQQKMREHIEMFFNEIE